MKPPSAAKIRLDRRIIRLCLIGLVPVAVCAFYATYLHTLHVIPKFPTPVAPVPNAFDDMERASSEVVNKDKLDTVYQRAYDERSSLSADTLQQVDSVVAANGNALRDAHKALSSVYQAPQIYGFDVLVPYYDRHRNVVRLISLAAKADVAHGRYDSAAETAVDAIQIGSKMPHNAMIIGTLTGLACEAIGVRTAVSTVDHASLNAAISSARRLETIDRGQVTFPAAVASDDRFLALSLAKTYQSKGGVKDVVALFGGDWKSRHDLATWMYCAAVPYDVAMNDVLKNMRASELLANKPYQEYVRAQSDPDSMDLMAMLLQPDYVKARLKLEQTNAKIRLLELQFALRAYHVDHARYPTALTSLVPAYVAALPPDPFAYTGGMHYRVNGDSYILYSVGPDGIDNGGKAITDAAKTGPARYWLTEPSQRGDLVAGVNL